jgi:hypothetical protein
MSLVGKVNDIAKKAKIFGMDDKELSHALLDAMDSEGISTMEMILHLNEKKKAFYEKRDRENWMGMDFACNALTELIQLVEKKKRPKVFIDNVLFEKDRIAYVVNFLKVWVPNPDKLGFSNTSRWMLKKSTEVFNFEKYLPGGESYDWAVQYDHAEYIQKLKALKESGALNKEEG